MDVPSVDEIEVRLRAISEEMKHLRHLLRMAYALEGLVKARHDQTPAAVSEEVAKRRAERKRKTVRQMHNEIKEPR